MRTKALVVVSFGTTYKEAQKSIENIETRLKNSLPDYDFFRAFTSKMVINKIAKIEGITIKTPEELLEGLYTQGYKEILCQSLHIINGIEFDKMYTQLQKYSFKFESLKLGKPLLSEEEDYRVCSKIVMDNIPKLESDEAVILMGHGTEHFANASYCQLESMIRFLNYEKVYVATVEGFPKLDYIINRISKKNITKIYLVPFMIVAGDHAQNDLSGDSKDSWQSILLKKGYKVEVILKGLGDYDEIAVLIQKHLQHAKRVVL